MSLPKMKLLSIVFEAVLKEQILESVLEQGAKGYTCTPVSGLGSRGIRQGPAGENLKVEVICSETVAEAIVAHVVKRYQAHYAFIAWVADVAVSLDASSS
jgi:nitrogen regulatory protein PII